MNAAKVIQQKVTEISKNIYLKKTDQVQRLNYYLTYSIQNNIRNQNLKRKRKKY